MKVIAVTGTPGTGKTTLAKKIAAQKGYTYIDVQKLIIKHELFDSYNKKLKTYDVDIRKFLTFFEGHIAKLSEEKPKGIVLDSHLSHELSPSLVDICYVTTCDLSALGKRLKRRGYSPQKIADNLEAEAFETCLCEARDFGHRVVVINTSKNSKRKPKNKSP